VLTGQFLVNFALNDLNGQPWEYRKQRGRLTLVDFWGTWCTACMYSVPHLKGLQDKYGNYGLRVVGIAYEEGPVAEQVMKVNRVKQRLAINYTTLLGAPRGECPVLQQFNVHAFPTLILLDDTGRIIWRSEGLDRQQQAELDHILRQRLRVR
jgi:thiol-disulfide isomerase/thioredoxin